MTTHQIPDAPCQVVPPGRGHRTHWLAVVEHCPLCGKRHTHGAGTDGTDLGLRAAHCGGYRHGQGREYRLVLDGAPDVAR